MNLPTTQQCLELFQKYKVPDHIKEHCLSVANLALFLAKKLEAKGENINLELVHRTALLHDLFKVVTLEKLEPNQYYPHQYSPEEVAMWNLLKQKYHGLHECEVAYLVFKKDFPELALTIRNASDPLKEDKTPEESLTHYADWRISNNRVVSLGERLLDLKERYQKGEEYWKERAKPILQKEKEIFSKLAFSPEELKRELEKYHF